MTTWKCHAEPATENNELYVLWVIEVRKDKIILSRRPDIVVFDETMGTNTITDLAVPLD